LLLSSAVAKTIAIEGMVLLKNDGSLLPLAVTTRVAVINAVNVRAVLVARWSGLRDSH
jgi:beta-glucosidase-like glycosyl hydrolase